MRDQNVLPELPPGLFLQWSADNVDHNSRTLDGRNTFHGMGIIAAVTPPVKNTGARFSRGTFGDLKKESTGKNIRIHDYVGNISYPKNMILKPIDLLNECIGNSKDIERIFYVKWITSLVR